MAIDIPEYLVLLIVHEHGDCISSVDFVELGSFRLINQTEYFSIVDVAVIAVDVVDL